MFRWVNISPLALVDAFSKNYWNRCEEGMEFIKLHSLQRELENIELKDPEQKIIMVEWKR